MRVTAKNFTIWDSEYLVRMRLDFYFFDDLYKKERENAHTTLDCRMDLRRAVVFNSGWKREKRAER